jgi:thiol-disulfide isomerase/thioredoxin
MNRRQWAFAGVGIAAAAAGAGWNSLGAGKPASPASALPDFWALRFARPDGSWLDIASLRGKPLLVNFWATWCTPCVKEMPLLDAFHAQHRTAGWQVLGLAVDSAESVNQFLSRIPVQFQIGLAGVQGIALARSLGNEEGGLPFSLAFDKQGSIMGRKLGALTESELSNWVSKGS